MTTAETFPQELAARYQPVRPLGEGAMGVVWLATDRASGQPVAVKVMSRLDDPRLVARTLRECEMLADLDHPAVLRFLDSGKVSTGPYLVTEYLEGASLAEVEPSQVDVEAVMMQIAEGLGEVHRRGLLHRDVKPENLFLTKDGRAVLLDFGLALDAERTRLTATSSNLLGTPAYLAPEVWRGRQASSASDWYAWGLSTFFLLEGHLPMEPQEIFDWALSGGEWRDAHLERSDPDLPLSRGVRACLDPDPDRRVQSLAELREVMGPPRSHPVAIAPDEVTTGSLSAPGQITGPYPVSEASRTGLVARVGGALALVMALIFGFLSADAPPAASAPEPGPSASALPVAPVAGEPFPLEFAQDLERELLLARRQAVTRTGRRIVVERMAQEDRLALSSDPIYFRASLEGLPELWRFLVWISKGGDVGTLSPELREDLLDLDGAYQAELGEPVLDPYLRPAPPEHQEPYVAEEWVVKKVGVRLGRAIRGRWTGAALRALGEAARIRQEYDEELSRSPQGPIRGGEVVAVGGLVGATDIDDYLTAVAIRPSTRNQARDWILPGIVQFRRALVLARKALEAGEPDEELAGCIFAEGAGDMGGFFVAGHSTLPAAIRDGGPGTRPATWFLRGEVVRKAAVRLEAFDADARPLRDALPEIWFRAMAPSPVTDADPRWVNWRRGRALWRLFRQAQKTDDPDLMRRAVATSLPWMHEVPAQFMERGGNDLSSYILRRPEGIGLTREQRVRILEVLDSVPGRRQFLERRTQLRKHWGL